MAKLTPTQVGVTTPTNAGASNKSAPASVPSVPVGFKKWLLLAFITLVVVICIVLIASTARSGNNAKQPIANTSQSQLSIIPLANSPQSSWPKLAMPPGGKSEIIPLPSGMRVIWAGYQFRNYTVYPDGHECAFNGTTPCPNGGTGTYANNEANVVNVVAYAFDPI